MPIDGMCLVMKFTAFYMQLSHATSPLFFAHRSDCAAVLDQLGEPGREPGQAQSSELLLREPRLDRAGPRLICRKHTDPMETPNDLEETCPAKGTLI